jgi:hypothetical protein
MPRSLLGALATLVVIAGCGTTEPGSQPTPPPTASGKTVLVPTATVETPLPPDVARIVCNAELTTVATSRIRPQRDGIHLQFENRAGKPLSYSIESMSGGGQGADLPLQGTEIVVALPPGQLSLACFDPNANEDPSKQERTKLNVADPQGLWTPAVLSSTCTMGVATTSDYAAGAEGEQRPPVEIARRFLEERSVLENDDVVEAAGYPDQDAAVVRLARDGETLAVLEFMSDGNNGWLPSTVNACAGIGLG